MPELDISQVDVLFTDGSYPIEMLLYYRNGLDSRIIREALKFLSQAFWPLCGEYTCGSIRFDGYSEEECFAEERCEEEFDTGATHANLYESYRRSNPNSMKKLFHIKILQYENGTVLIPKMNHLAGDGYSYFYFLSALAAVSRGRRIPFRKQMVRYLIKPHHGRTRLREFTFREDVPRPLPDDRVYTIELEKIAKQAVQSSIEGVASRLDLRISANDILSSMAMKKTLKLQNKLFGDQVQLTMPIDVRRRVPEYGRKFFGNGIMLKTVTFETQEIVDSSVEDAAVAVRHSMPDVTRASFIDYMKGLEATIADKQYERLKPFDPDRGCLVTNISRLPLDRLDFGTGRPDLVFPLTIEQNSVAILSEKDNFVLRFAFSPIPSV
ncbi:MAG: acyltransferase [Candidatus Aminicenantaceae bacterium]